MKTFLKALFGDMATCLTAVVAIAAAVAMVLGGQAQLASWLLPPLLLAGAVYLAQRYGRG